LKLALAKWAAIALAGAGFVAWAGWFVYETSFTLPDDERYYCLFDDAMISMRYAWNLAHGEGLVWNPGERVEGITNLLWTLFMTPFAALLSKPAAVLAVQISGLVLILVAAVLGMKIGEELLAGGPLAGRRFLSLLFFAVGLAYYPFDFWSMMGTEAALQTVLLFAAIWLALRVDGSVRHSLPLGVILGLLFLTRPDSAVQIALILLFRLSAIVRRPGWRKVILIEGGVVAGFVAAVTIFRLAYYGSAVPNTYDLKMVGYPLSIRLENAFLFLKPFWAQVAGPLAICAISLVLHWDRRRALVLGVVVSAIAYQFYIGGDAWRHWRLLASFIPLLLVLAVVDAATLIHTRGAGGPLVRLTERRLVPPMPFLEHALVLVVAVLCVLQANAEFKEEVLFEKRPMSVKYHARQVALGLALSEIALPGATVGVNWAGTVPYYSGVKGVDFLGKTDPHIASLEPDFTGALGGSLVGMVYLPGHAKYDLEYSIKKLEPTYVQFDKWGTDDLREYVREHYRTTVYMGVPFRARRDSPHLDWEKIKANRRRPKKKKSD
jgi:hypothetical protein